MRGRRLTLVAIAALLVAVVVAAVLWQGRVRSKRIWTDDVALRLDADQVAPGRFLWGPPRPFGPASTTSLDAAEPTLDDEGDGLIFVVGRPGGEADLREARRGAAGWEEPRAIPALEGPADELGPALASDGSFLLFASDRAGGAGGYDLWISRRESGAWSAPEPLGPGVNTAGDEYAPTIAPDRTSLVYVARSAAGDADLMSVALDSGRPTGAAARIESLSSPAHDASPAFSPRGDSLYFASDRAGGAGGFDLWRARRRGDGGWAPPEPLGPPVATEADELDPALLHGGFRLVFAQRDADGVLRLRASDAREVRADHEQWRTALDRALLGRALAWTLAALAAGILAWLLARLLRGVAAERLGFVGRALIASSIAHLILMTVLALWGVGNALQESPGRGSTAVAVALAAPAAGTEIARQLQAAPAASDATASMQAAAIPAATIATPALSAREVAPAIDRAASSPTPSATEASPAPALTARAAETPAHPAPPPAAPATSRYDAPQTVARATRDPERRGVPGAASLPADAVAPALDPVDSAPRTARSAPAPVASATEALPSASAAMPEAESSTPTLLVALPMADAARSATPAAGPAAPPRDESDTDETAALLAARAAAPIAVPGGDPPPVQPIERRGASKVGAAPSAPAPQSEVAPAPSAITESRLAASELAALALPALDERFATPSSPTPREESAMASAEEIAILAPAAAPLRREATSAPTAPSIVEAPRAAPAQAVPASALATPPMSRPSDDGAPASAIAAMPRSDLALPDLAASRFATPVPARQEKPAPVHPQRDPEVRPRVLVATGGTEETEAAVAAGLDWLARHQRRDGAWDGDGFDADCACGDVGRLDVDVAMTGLAALAFLAADHRPDRPGPHRETVDRALEHLLAAQGADGDCSAGESLYTHGIAAIALAEAWGATRDPRFGAATRRAVAFTDAAGNREEGGWRYAPGQPGDLSVTGWQVMALIAARRAGAEVPDRAFEPARILLERTEAQRHPGRHGYQPGHPATVAMTAEALFVRALLGEEDAARDAAAARFILGEPPTSRGEANTYAWYYATLALFQRQDRAWTRWNDRLRDALVARQRADGHAAGSWDPSDSWSRSAGRVYQTAICVLTLEVYYRYLPLFADPFADQAARNEASAPPGTAIAPQAESSAARASGMP